MRCPTLNELPPPPPGKACTEQGQSAGWSWTIDDGRRSIARHPPSTARPWYHGDRR